MEQSKKRKALNYIVGALILIFVGIGLVSTVRFLSSHVQHLSLREQQREQFRTMLRPVVMNDPATFDDVSLANPDELLSIAIWNILLQNPDPDRYDFADGQMLLPQTVLLPQTEVEDSLHALFGADVTVQHTTVDGGGVTFSYAEKKRCYTIPITGITPIYSPRIDDMTVSGDRVVLTVGYLSGEDVTQNENGELVLPEPAKRMRITLRRGAENQLFISAIQDIYS